jgi:4-amino-4-deoxy-L-arabinose transferase-like glycosyltransferase
MDALSALSTWLRRQGWLVVLIALVQLGLHLWTNAHDNIFRDGMYYLAAAFSRGIFGDSVFAIRLLPGLAAAVVVILTANMAAILGGGWATQALAAVAVALAPVFMGSSGLLTMDPFDQLWWTLAAWVLVGLIKQQEPRRWLIFGVAVGLGLLTKLTMSFFVMALLAGLLLSESRKLLFNR